MDECSNVVLIMDDEERIRDLLGTMLELLGYTVCSCATGEEAVANYRLAMDEGRPFLTAIMDLIVFGGMGGKDAAREILSADPAARLVVSSGYSCDAVLTDCRSHGFFLALPKPYRLRDLAQVMDTLKAAA